jgi:hypothetical protein
MKPADESTPVERTELPPLDDLFRTFKSEHADAVTYAMMVIQAAARQLALLDVEFPVVLDALVEAHASTLACDKLETSHALYESSLNLAHPTNRK